MKIDLPNMDFDIPSIPDSHFEPKINYKALEEIGKSREEYLTTLRDAILSIDKQQQEAVRQLEQQTADSDKKHKQSMRKANWQIAWAVIASVIAFLTLVFTFFPDMTTLIKQAFAICMGK